MVAELVKTIDVTNVRGLSSNLGVENENEINKLLLFTAIAQQFKEIIDGKGEGRDVVNDVFTRKHKSVIY